MPNSKWLEEDNPYHRTEYGYEAAIEAFAGFDDCLVLYQFLAEGSLIRSREGSDLAGRLVAMERGEPEYANHFIACVNLSAELDAAPDWARIHLRRRLYTTVTCGISSWLTASFAVRTLV